MAWSLINQNSFQKARFRGSGSYQKSHQYSNKVNVGIQIIIVPLL